MILKQLLSYCTSCAQEEHDKMRMITDLLRHKDVMVRNKLKFLHFTFSALVFNRDRDHVLLVYDLFHQFWTWFEVHFSDEADIRKLLVEYIKNRTGLKQVKLICDDILSIQMISESFQSDKDLKSTPHFHYTLTFAFSASMNDFINPYQCDHYLVKWLPINEIENYITSKTLLSTIKKVADRCRYLLV